MSEASSIARPRVWRLQFSLRLLLVAFTAFAIGFPVWYRWPYRETIEQRDSVTGKVEVTRIITWQRQWGGHRVAHGPEQIIVSDSTITTNNVQGKKRGPFTHRNRKGRYSVTGQYVDDLKEGRWMEERGGERTVMNWRHGLLDGESTFTDDHGKQLVVTFMAGRLVRYNGKPIDDATFDTLQRRQIDERTAAELSKEINVDFVEVPLKDVVMFVGDLHAIPTAVDLKGGVDVDLPITASSRGMDLQSALVLMLAPHGLACDYRYGTLWVAKADSIREWRDPTGVADIKPPSGSALARAWSEPIAVDCATASRLVKVLAYIEQKMGVSIDASRVPAKLIVAPLSVSVGWTPGSPAPTLRDRPLRHVLGHLLYNCGCRCKLEGDMLVLLPPDGKAE